MEWYALYVKSRAEKKVAERLSAQGIAVFCPMETVLKQWSDRKKEIEQPFFRSYVFARFDFGARLEVLQVLGVVNMVYWLKKPAVIRDKEMLEVISFFEQNKARKINTKSIVIGQRRSVTDGLLKDRIGIVVKHNKKKLVLAIAELGLVFTVDTEQTVEAE